MNTPENQIAEDQVTPKMIHVEKRRETRQAKKEAILGQYRRRVFLGSHDGMSIERHGPFLEERGTSTGPPGCRLISGSWQGGRLIALIHRGDDGKHDDTHFDA